MRVLNKYTAGDFLVTFLLTLAVITFVMCVGAVIKAIDLLARGVSGVFILQIFAFNIPFILTFTIPMSTLTAVLLLFGRLSYDGEITAMKACGISMWQIISPVLLLSIVLSGVCVYLQGSLAPRSHFAQRRVLANLGMEEPINLLEEGRFVRDFPGLMVYVGKKDERKVEDIVVYETGEDGVMRNVRAERGEIRADPKNNLILIDLYNVQMHQPDKENPLDPSKARYLSAEHYPVKLDVSKLTDDRSIRKKTVDMTYQELFLAIRHQRETFQDLSEEDLKKQRMKMVLEINERLALSLSCFAFTLLGIPLGLKSNRKESSIGIGISLLLVFFFYFFIILADSLVGSPQWRPDLITWIPVILAEAIGFYLISRQN